MIPDFLYGILRKKKKKERKKDQWFIYNRTRCRTCHHHLLSCWQDFFPRTQLMLPDICIPQRYTQMSCIPQYSNVNAAFYSIDFFWSDVNSTCYHRPTSLFVTSSGCPSWRFRRRLSTPSTPSRKTMKPSGTMALTKLCRCVRLCSMQGQTTPTWTFPVSISIPWIERWQR